MKTQTKPLRKSRATVPIDEHAIRLKAFRKFINLTQAELGKEFGVDQSMIYKYENFLNIIPIELPKLLHKKFGMSYEWFYHNIGPMDPKSVNKMKPTKLFTDTKQLEADVIALKNELTSLKNQMKKFARDLYSTE